MKAFIKALPSALFPIVLIVGMVILFQFMFYGVQSFEDFFGVAVGKFNLVRYIIVFVVLWVTFALYFKSDYEEELK